MSKTETMNQKYIDKYISELQDSRFYIEDDVVREVYYNPDSDAGGQFVTNLHSPSSVIEAHEKCLDNDTHRTNPVRIGHKDGRNVICSLIVIGWNL